MFGSFPRLHLFSLLGLLFWIPGLSAAIAPDLEAGLNWSYCGQRPARLGPSRLPQPPNPEEPIAITADDFSYDQAREQLYLLGNIDLRQGSRHLRSEVLRYDLNTKELFAPGQIYLEQPRIRLLGTEAQLNLQNERGQIKNPRYRFTGPLNARGSARLAELLGTGRSRYSDLLYSTCKPGQRDWDLTARSLEIDEEAGQGIARDAKLRVLGVPVLYSPYLSFPLDDRRKSGFLVPTFGNSSESGIEILTPYYFNLAPNYDATLYPHYIEKRGMMIGGEFRFLTPHHAGEFYGEIIQDQQYEDRERRSALRFLYHGKLGKWSAQIQFYEVSDTAYLGDFGNRLEVTSLRNIPRSVQLSYNAKRWQAFVRLKDFQTVDDSIAPENRPYAQLPQVSWTLKPYRLPLGLRFDMKATYDYFDHAEKVYGQRISLRPSLSWPLRKAYGYLIPRVNLYGARYALNRVETDDPHNPSYAIPSVLLDGKLVFEREVRWFGKPSLQTLEPRLFYLYTPYRDQDEIPVFDSAELSFSYDSLFRANRFSGSDRIGDADQLTLGLTSRTLDSHSGREWFRASLGQIFYFQPRQVQISGEADEEPSSAIAAEMSARLLAHLSGRLSLQWDPNRREAPSRKRVLELRYHPMNNRLLNLSYRFDLGTSEATRYEDLDLSFRWPLGAQVEMVGRWFYSLRNHQTTEALAGIEFGRCCWKLRILGRHLRNQPDTVGKTSFMVQLVLSGLGHVGNSIDQLLEREIYGYHAD